MSNYYDTNRDARIATRIDRTGKIRTETQRRDQGSLNAAVSTDVTSNTTRLFIDMPDGVPVKLNGHQARSLFRVLSKHYANAGMSTEGI